jgi:hypothetical protein
MCGKGGGGGYWIGVRGREGGWRMEVGVGRCRLRNAWVCREVVALLAPGWFTTGWGMWD